ncbi:MAG: FumA C-terminus/TtdB family hydratase beta subunit [Proteobacteria bacterium]|nr:FumA C-terminus/TtdB family hydratase beta subunit [Pseudomonadota bacterium]
MADPFVYKPLFPVRKEDLTSYIKIAEPADVGIVTESALGVNIVKVSQQAIEQLVARCFYDMSHLFRRDHLEGWAGILQDPQASDNDRYVATQLLRNAVIASQRLFPSCQDTGTAIILAWKGEQVWVERTKGEAGKENRDVQKEAISAGVYATYTSKNLRYSQMLPLSMYKEVNSGSNLPAQIEISAVPGDSYRFLCIAKGGGSANKSFLYQKTRALLNKENMNAFLRESLLSLGTAACPPYHLAVVVGGLSSEQNLHVLKLATCRYYDYLPTEGNVYGQAFRDTELEEDIVKIAQDIGIGAQFGGKYFIQSVRVIRLPRHAASLVVGMGVSCSADRQILGKITSEGVFVEQLESDPSKYLPQNSGSQRSSHDQGLSSDIDIDLSDSMENTLATLSSYEVGRRVMLHGPMVVARDAAHARLLENHRCSGKIPEYFKRYPVYYAGPAKTPPGYASGSFGPTTSQRMDSYVPIFQKAGASMVMLGKGNRSRSVVQSCAEHGGFYLGSIGGPAAILGKHCIKKVEVLDFEDLGMEAVWKIEVKNFPAFIITDDKGHDFFLKTR